MKPCVEELEPRDVPSVLTITQPGMYVGSQYPGVTQVLVENTSNVMVEGFTCNGNQGTSDPASGYGILFWFVTSGTIANCTCSDNGGGGSATGGIEAFGCSRISISHCISTDNRHGANDGDGIVLDACSNSSIEHCYTSGNDGAGLWLGSSPYPSINCIVSDNISDNDGRAGPFAGLLLAGEADYSTVTDNVVECSPGYYGPIAVVFVCGFGESGTFTGTGTTISGNVFVATGGLPLLNNSGGFGGFGGNAWVSAAASSYQIVPMGAIDAVYTPTTGNWYLSDGVTFQYGFPGTDAVAGNFFGDGQQHPAVYFPTTGEWYIDHNTEAGDANPVTVQFGFPGTLPVVGDWLGDGVDRLGVYWPATGEWFLNHNRLAGDVRPLTFQYGFPGTVPVVGANATPCVYWSAGATWFLGHNQDAGDASPVVERQAVAAVDAAVYAALRFKLLANRYAIALAV